MVKLLLRLEGLALFIVASLLYRTFGYNWGIFALLILTPDISILGYYKNKKFGAIIYNIVHNYVAAIALITVGLVSGQKWLLSYGTILLAHIGIDRFLGLGLKYPTAFKDTHLHRV